MEFFSYPWDEFFRVWGKTELSEFLHKNKHPFLLARMSETAETPKDYHTVFQPSAMETTHDAGPSPDDLDFEDRVFEIKPDPNNALEMTMQRVAIGRAEGNEICIPHGKVSKFHAYIMNTPDRGFVIYDADSTNGTMLNGNDLIPRTHYPLNDGDLIQISNVGLAYLTPEGMHGRLQAEGASA